MKKLNEAIERAKAKKEDCNIMYHFTSEEYIMVAPHSVGYWEREGLLNVAELRIEIKVKLVE
jgi:hypothetical protein